MLLKAIILGLLYWLIMGRSVYFASLALRNPLVLGVVIGLIFGDVKNGLIYGATIQLVWMGVVEAGGNIPTDQALASFIAIPAAIVNNVSPSAVVAIAVPFGVLGVLLNNGRVAINTFYNAPANKAVEERNYNRLSHFSFIIPWLTNGVIYFTPVFVATLFGSSVLKAFIKIVPTWFMNGLNSAGLILPALGFALTMIVIGKKKYLPIFILGFFIFTIAKYSMLTAAIIGTCLALIILLFKQNDDEEAA
ncbi:PTS sugar transporter subunit IIC [Oenococcus oeni]